MTTVEAITATGSGCPGATPTATLDGDAITVTIPGYTAKRGTGSQPTDLRKNCQFSLKITGPAGSHFALAGVDTQGSIVLNAGSTAKLKVSYYFQGTSATNSISRDFTGPETGGWADDSSATAPLVYGDGSKLLNVNTELRVAGTGSAADSISISSPVIVHLVWQ